MRKTQRRKAKEQGEQVHGDVKRLGFCGNCGLFSKQKISGMVGQRVGGTRAVKKIRRRLIIKDLTCFHEFGNPITFFSKYPGTKTCGLQLDFTCV